MSEEKKVWEAKKEAINRAEFDEARRCLLNLYHSYVQNHAGYVIALVVGFLALISALVSNLAFFLEHRIYLLIFSIVVGPAFGLGMTYLVFRIAYWTSCANASLGITLDDAILFFNYFNSTLQVGWVAEAPYTAILQMAAYQSFRIGNPRLLWTEGILKNRIYYWRPNRKRKADMEKLIKEAEKDRNAEEWIKANDKLEVAYKYATVLKDSAKEKEILKQQKEMPKADIPFIY